MEGLLELGIEGLGWFGCVGLLLGLVVGVGGRVGLLLHVIVCYVHGGNWSGFAAVASMMFRSVACTILEGNRELWVVVDRQEAEASWLHAARAIWNMDE